ncbi:hypothetical protein NL676_030556 [Syzygium grande]|nr:hypothetical protein NL676_030556 [Syzygium grande]
MQDTGDWDDLQAAELEACGVLTDMFGQDISNEGKCSVVHDVNIIEDSPQPEKNQTFLENFSYVPVMALTATATHSVREDILKALGVPHALVLETSFDRPNLKYEVIAKTKEPLKQLGELLKNCFANFRGTEYCLSKSEYVDVAKYLNEKCLIKTVYYHARLAARPRVAVQKKWHTGEV